MLFRLFFLVACIVIVSWVINAILKGIITTFGRFRPNQPPQRNSRFNPDGSHHGMSQKFDDIKDAEYTDVTDDEK
jgi:hypothetical protein